MNCILQGQIKGANKELSNLNNYQKALRNIGGRPNRNLLDNWYFVGGGSQQGGGQFPINQRRETSYTGGGYGIDRWKSIPADTTIAVGIDGLHLSYKESAWIFLQEFKNVLHPGETYTISVLYKASGNPIRLVLTWGDYLYFFNEGAPVSEEWALASVTGTIPDDATINYEQFIVQAIGTGEGAIDLLAAKLELGDHQTLAYQDEEGNWQLFETPDYGEELAKCQRYQYPIISDLVRASLIGSSSQIFFFLPIATNLRTTPTIKNINEVLKIRDINGGDQTGFTFAISSNRAGGLFISATKVNHGMSDATLSCIGTISNPVILDANI